MSCEDEGGNRKMKYKFMMLGHEQTGELIEIRDERATVLVDGYSCSDTIPIADLIEATNFEISRDDFTFGLPRTTK